MDLQLFWGILVIVAVLLFLFFVFPSLLEKPVEGRPVDVVAAAAEVADQAAREAAAREAAADASRRAAAAELDTHYQDAASCIPIDYPAKAIGACPDVKPQKGDLPVANMPMCMLVQSRDMRLAPYTA